jgi:hypothetical protein
MDKQVINFTNSYDFDTTIMPSIFLSRIFRNHFLYWNAAAQYFEPSVMQQMDGTFEKKNIPISNLTYHR